MVFDLLKHDEVGFCLIPYQAVLLFTTFATRRFPCPTQATGIQSSSLVVAAFDHGLMTIVAKDLGQTINFPTPMRNTPGQEFPMPVVVAGISHWHHCSKGVRRQSERSWNGDLTLSCISIPGLMAYTETSGVQNA